MSEYKICHRCGAQLDSNDNFCTTCGAPVSENPSVAGGNLASASTDEGDKAHQAAPGAAVPASETLGVASVSEAVVRSGGPTDLQGKVDATTPREPTAPSAVPAVPAMPAADWDPSSELSHDGEAGAPSGPIPTIVSPGAPTAPADAGAPSMADVTGTSVAPVDFVPPAGGDDTDASDAAGQAPVRATPPSDVDASETSADDQWLAKALGIDMGAAPSGSASTLSGAPASPADAPAAPVSASSDDVSAASSDAFAPYITAPESDADASAPSASVPVVSTDQRLADDLPVSESPTANAAGSPVARRSSKGKVVAGVGVVLLVVLAALGFLLYRHSREEAARDAIAATTQSMVACDKSLQGLDGIVEINHSYLPADEADTVKDELNEASSSLDDAKRSLESARSDGWALDDDGRHTLDVLQDGLDARKGMIDSGGQLIDSLADVRSAAEALARLMTDSSLFLGSSDNVVNVLNSSSRYIDQIDAASMANDLENAKKYQGNMSDDLRAAREKLPAANLSKYQTVVDRASVMATALQGMVDAIQAQDATRANDAATALNAAIDSFNDARRELPLLAESVEPLVPDSTKGHVEDYRAKRERVVETLRELEGNPLTRDVAGGSMFLQASQDTAKFLA